MSKYHSGIGTVIDTFSRNLNKNKFTARVICLTNDIFNSKLNLSKAYFEYKALKNAYGDLEENIDLVHFHGGWTLHILMLNHIKVPTILSPHGALHRVSLQKSKIFKYLAKAFYMKKSYSKADCILAATEDEVQDILSFGLNNSCIALIPNSIDLNEELEIDNAVER